MGGGEEGEQERRAGHAHFEDEKRRTECGVFTEPSSLKRGSYFEIERRNIRSIFSLVSITAGLRGLGSKPGAWFAALCAPLAVDRGRLRAALAASAENSLQQRDPQFRRLTCCLRLSDIGLQRLQVLAAGQHGERCNGGNLDNRTLHNDQSPYWWLSKSASLINRKQTRCEQKVDSIRRPQLQQIRARCLQLIFLSLSACGDILARCRILGL